MPEHRGEPEHPERADGRHVVKSLERGELEVGEQLLRERGGRFCNIVPFSFRIFMLIFTEQTCHATS